MALEWNIKQEPELQIGSNVAITPDNTFLDECPHNKESIPAPPQSDSIMSLLSSLSQRVSRMEAQQNARLNRIEKGIQKILSMLSDGQGSPTTVPEEEIGDFQKINSFDSVVLFDGQLKDGMFFNKMVTEKTNYRTFQKYYPNLCLHLKCPSSGQSIETHLLLQCIGTDRR